MIDNADFVQLSECCFNMCDALRSAVQRKKGDDPNDSQDVNLGMELKDLERCVTSPPLFLISYQVFPESRAKSRGPSG